MVWWCLGWMGGVAKERKMAENVFGTQCMNVQMGLAKRMDGE